MARETPTSARIAQGTLWSLLSSGTTLVGSLLAMPLYLYYLGDTRYGLLLLIGVVISYAEILDLGISSACLRHGSAALRCAEPVRLRQFVATGWLLQGLVGLWGATALWILAPWIVEQAFQVPSLYQREMLHALYVSAGGLMITFLGGIPAVVATIHGRFDIYGKVSLVSFLLKMLGGVLASMEGYGLVGISLANLGVDSATALFNIWMASQYLRGFRGLLPTWEAFRQLFQFGRSVALGGILQRLMGQWEKVLIGRYLSPGAVPYYSIPHSLFSRYILVPGAIGASILPELAGLYARGERETFSTLALRSVRYITLVLLPLTMFFLITGYDLLALWLNPAFAEKSTPLLRILGIGAFIHALGHIGAVVMYATNRPHVQTLLYFIQALLYFPCADWLISRYELSGAAGVWSGRVAIEGLVMLSLFAVSVSLRGQHIKRFFWRRGVFFQVGWGLLVALLYATILQSLSPLLRLLVGGGLFWVGIAGILYRWGVDTSEIHRLLIAVGMRRTEQTCAPSAER